MNLQRRWFKEKKGSFERKRVVVDQFVDRVREEYLVKIKGG
jgi:hypothetical protein